MLCGSLDGTGVWGRMDTYMCMAESLRCSPETITTLLIDYILIQNKKFKRKNPTILLLYLIPKHPKMFSWHLDFPYIFLHFISSHKIHILPLLLFKYNEDWEVSATEKVICYP